MAPQMIPMPKFEVRCGHKITSPLPKPIPKRIKLGPINFLRGRGVGRFFVERGLIGIW